jgi:protein-tyrosine phosphatase
LDYVDLHSHVLFGIDDGARSLEDSLEMLKLLSAIGFSLVCATPHQKVGSFVPSDDSISERHGQVCAGLGEAG